MAELLEPMTDIDLAVIDVDTNVDLVNTFEVKAVPAVLAFRNGVVVDKFIGLVDSTMIENLISKLQSSKPKDTWSNMHRCGIETKIDEKTIIIKENLHNNSSNIA